MCWPWKFTTEILCRRTYCREYSWLTALAFFSLDAHGVCREATSLPWCSPMTSKHSKGPTACRTLSTVLAQGLTTDTDKTFLELCSSRSLSCPILLPSYQIRPSQPQVKGCWLSDSFSHWALSYPRASFRILVGFFSGTISPHLFHPIKLHINTLSSKERCPRCNYWRNWARI